jgi:hypothetical protein
VSAAPALPTASQATALALLRALLRGDRSGLASLLQCPPDRVAAALDCLERQRLLGYTYRSLERLGLADRLTPALRTPARAAYLRQWVQNERLAGELVRLAERCEAGGVRMLSVKGPLLAQRFYGDLGARWMADLDLLVRSYADADRLETLLRADGYVPTHGVLLGRRLSQLFTHHFAYRREATTVELHWALQRHVSLRFDYARLWAEAEPIELHGRTLRAPSAEYQLVLQIVGILTDLQVGTLTLKPLVDLYAIARGSGDVMDWAGFLHRRRGEGLHTASVHALAALVELLGSADGLPGLAAALDGVRARGVPVLRYALAGSRVDARQKLAGLRLFDTPLPVALGWWALSLPFRLTVHAEESGRLFGSSRRPVSA